jgi:hypothetical protein
MADTNHTNASVNFEHRDVNARSMAWVLAAIVVTAIVLHLVLYFLYEESRSGSVESGRIPKATEPTRQQTSSQPKLQVDPSTDIDQLRREENKKLTTYGWIDKDKGVVRIPIEQAMRSIADRGLAPANTAGPAGSAATPAQRVDSSK